MEVRVLPGEQNSGIIVSVLPPPLQRYTGAGIVAQLVEQQTENLCVVGSIPTDTTESRYNGKPPLPYGSRSVKPVKGVYMEFEALMVKRWFVVPKNSVRYRTNSQNCLHSLIGKILEYESRDVGVRLFLGTQKSLLI